MDPNQYNHIENFVEGMTNLSEKIRQFDPDHIIAPMIGAVPFIDVLCIIDDKFENEKVEYIPASNKIKSVKRVMRNWFKNFLDENYSLEPIKIVSIDEVISGSSMLRVYKQAQAAIQEKASEEMMKPFLKYGSDEQIRSILTGEVKQRMREEQARLINYFPFGIVDEGLRRSKKIPFNKEYQKLIEERKTDSVSVECIPTMDRPEFFPVNYRRVSDGSTKHHFYPTISGFNVSESYIEFLQTVAKIVGKNPEGITFNNMAKILNSTRYLSPELRGDY
ncbi:MAG: hypothetical protein ABH824_05995 [Nanoarchaeota archaeon]|nr:hypothetical protein [Nanoarchaeota archaeon]MBU1631791.1 hypothetical protein [Nanoarchaeota archaeon]MBU1876018.1 hypothetical protein [Nanoarchaeota archaeon]